MVTKKFSSWYLSQNDDTGIISVTAIIIISLFQSNKTTEAVAQRAEACNFIKKETMAQAFTCKFF